MPDMLFLVIWGLANEPSMSSMAEYQGLRWVASQFHLETYFVIGMRLVFHNLLFCAYMITRYNLPIRCNVSSCVFITKVKFRLGIHLAFGKVNVTAWFWYTVGNKTLRRMWPGTIHKITLSYFLSHYSIYITIHIYAFCCKKILLETQETSLDHSLRHKKAQTYIYVKDFLEVYKGKVSKTTFSRNQ